MCNVKKGGCSVTEIGESEAPASLNFSTLGCMRCSLGAWRVFFIFIFGCFCGLTFRKGKFRHRDDIVGMLSAFEAAQVRMLRVAVVAYHDYKMLFDRFLQLEESERVLKGLMAVDP